MSTIRVQKTENYSVINNTGLNDASLSFKAKGILAYLLSKPNDWKCQVNDLIKNSKDGRDSVYGGLKELREHGYMIKRPVKNEKNVITEWEESLYETPQTEAMAIYQEQLVKNELAAVKRAETIMKKKEPLTENTEVEKPTYGKAVNGEAVYGKAVDIINTNLLSTELPSTELVVEVGTQSVSDVNLEKYFEENICQLKPTTLKKFNSYCSQLAKDYIIALIDYCTEINTKSYAGFETSLMGFLTSGANTVEKLQDAILKFRESKKKLREAEKKRRANTGTPKSKESNFNNFDQRHYNYEALENQMLGYEEYNAEALHSEG